MDATPAVRLTIPRPQRSGLGSSARRALGTLLATLVNVTALLLAVRRGTGAIAEPLGPTAFILVVLAVAWAAGLARLLGANARETARVTRRRGSPAGGTRRRFPARLWIEFGPSLSLALLLTALSVPGTAPRPIVVAMVVVAAEELIVWYEIVRWPRSRRGRSASIAGLTEESPVVPFDVPRSPLELEASLYQRMVRHRLSGGLDHIEADCVAVFDVGQRHAIEHLAFCPPFAATPDVHYEQIDGPEARIGEIRSLPYGARVELRLPAPVAAETKVVFRLTATAPTSEPASAAIA
jgi:hypothetical protein